MDNRYSREAFFFGIDRINKISASSIIISGMGGLGVEIAKNLILSGIKNVTIHDTRNTELRDLASNYYLTEKSIGKNRALESMSQLSLLNPYVTVQSNTDELSNSLLINYKYVIVTDYHSESDIKRISTFCHQNSIKLILTETCGVFAYLFNDFSSNFFVEKPTLEKQSKFYIENVSIATNGIVTLIYDMDGLNDGDYVIFDEVKGMTELNGQIIKVKKIDHDKFSICDTTKYGKYIPSNANITKVILPLTIDFLEFNEALKKQEKMSLSFDSYKDNHEKEKQVILCFISCHHCSGEKVTFDQLLNAATEVNSIYKIVDEIDIEILREFSRESGAVISPTCSVFGGIVALEIIKSITGFLVPIDQFLAMQWTAALPKDVKFELKNDRYDPYRIVFGNQQQEVMENLRYFIVGAGSLGCEHIKNMALMGVATGAKGQLYVTDDATIERSNCDAYLLFKKEDVGKMKSDLVCRSIHGINSSVKIESFHEKYNSEHSSKFGDSFYMSLDGVCNAADDEKSHFFTDQECIFYNKAFFDTKSVGAIGTFTPVIPHLTDSIFSSKGPVVKYVTMDVIYSFPYEIEHCIKFARIYLFENFFIKLPLLISIVLNDSDYLNHLDGGIINELYDLKEALIDEKCENFIDCIKWARNQFDIYFNHKICEVQKYCSNSTESVWTGHNRYPTPITFDATNKLHAQFVISATLIKARTFGIQNEDVDILKIANDCAHANLESTRKYYFKNEEEKVEHIKSLYKEISPYLEKLKCRHFNPEKIDLKDMTNNQLDFFEAATAIRAINYNIKNTLNRSEILEIIMKIKPTIIPTAAMISGLFTLEIYKVHSIDNNKKIDDFRMASINLEKPVFCIFDPIPCQVIECPANSLKYTIWDKWIIEGDLTVEEFIKAAKDKYNVAIDMMTSSALLVYPIFNDSEKNNQRLKTKLTKVIEDYKGVPFSDDQSSLQIEVLCSDEDGNDIEIPKFILKFK